MINTVNEYVDINERSPYACWLSQIKDKVSRAKIMARVDRMELGNFGDSKSVGEGVSELRLHFGSGYRVYYARENTRVYILLCGGDKSSQSKDIENAKLYWADFKRRNKNDK